MRVDAALLNDPKRLGEALATMLMASRLWSLFWRPTDAEWATDWYCDPASAWWEQ